MHSRNRVRKNKESVVLNHEYEILKEQLKQSEDRFFKAFSTSPVPMTIAKLPEGVWVMANESFQKMTEYSLNEIIGHTSAELNLIKADERAHLIETLNAQGSLISKEFIARTKSGKKIYIVNSSVIISIDGQDHAVTLFYDLTERKAAEEKLKQSEARLLEAQKLARFGNFVYDLKKHTIEWSDQMYEIWGFDKEKGLPPYKQLWERIHPNDRERLENSISGKNRSMDNVEMEFRILLPDDRVKYVQLIIQKIYDESGELIRREGVAIDITERQTYLLKLEDAYDQIKERLQERDVLLREIFHRTKNNMQLISSMLNLKTASLANSEVKNLVEDVQERIKAISLVHEKLYKGDNLSKINLKEYIISLGELLLAGTGIEFKYDLQEIEILIDTAIPTGLVLTELILNSIKHAFPDHRPGSIDIKLRKIPENEIEIKVSDNGTGYKFSVDHSEEKIGLQILRSLVEDQLDGKLDVNTDNGVKWTITFKNQQYSERV